ncbi:3-oxoacyl-ACP synthase III family protein [Nocardia takedensis]|uniref:3-oxoacyl-ACP synthase III family protein n=1 Tax=Nocardia takedensis TaxID=259390 RepID=UPI0005953BC9|nr:3-oxoacyl-ACP synthase III family protein [Nocardia takedensis]
MAAPVVRILSAGTALPGPAVDNATLARALGLSTVFEQWIDGFIGTRTRHLAVRLDTGEVGENLADLGEEAARAALIGAGVDAADIDLIVLGTSMPDSLMPATVNLIADRLGIDGIPTYQLQSGCSGAMQALDVAQQMLLSGRHRTALVIGGDVCAKHVDLAKDYSKLPPGEIVNTVLFGDGAGAAVLTTVPADGSAAAGIVLHRVLVRLTGMNKVPGQVVEWFGMGDRAEERSALHEDFKAIEEQVPPMSVEILEELLHDLDWRREEVDYLLPPQLSVSMTGRIVAELAVPNARELSCVEYTGNTGNAVPFFQLELLLPLMEVGQRAVAIAVESSKWIKGGFVVEKVAAEAGAA